uniref:Uncharacterized protein n=1 Tax=viral metagenome TaxID=1070528 RepID=A0A6M3K2B4_9ZZZZ
MISMDKFAGSNSVSQLLNKMLGLLTKRIIGGNGINVKRSGNNLVIEAQPGLSGGASGPQKAPYWVPYADE